MFKKWILIAGLGLLLALSGCTLTAALGDDNAAPAATFTPTVNFAPTAATLAPTLGPGVPTIPPTLAPPTLTASPTGGSGPTPLPAPTQISVVSPTPTAIQGTPDPNATPAAPAPAPSTGGSGPGISMDPQLGEPLDVVVVSGSGFAPNEEVTLHWGKPEGKTGPEYWSLETDGEGKFSVGLIVPPADQWPGGSPQEGDYLQLRAFSESLEDFYYWANFRYIRRFNPVTSLPLTLSNTDWDYEIDVPNGWTWTWEEDKTENVRFAAGGGGAGRGFVRVIETTDVNAAISAVMSAEGLTAASTRQATLGNFPGTEVTTTNGRIVWFIPARSRVYALSFTDENGQFYTLVASSLRIK